MMNQHDRPPSLDDLAAIAEAELGLLPTALKRHVAGVVLRIDEFPDDDTLEALGLESPFDLAGLYRGVDLGRKSGGFIAHDVDMIFLYRRPILDEWCETGESLRDLVRHVLIHEIGHHFGLSDDAMHTIEAREGD